MGLADLERKLERLVEGAFAKAFRSGVAPVELLKRLVRQMDAERTHGVRGVIAPNHFTIALAPADHERFVTFKESLVRDLADAAREHARGEGYQFVGPVKVELTEDPGVSTGTFLLASEVREGPGGRGVGTVVMPDGQRVSVGDDPVCIGRMPECEITLSDQNVSRRHAEVRRQAGEFVVVDLGSPTGTSGTGSGV
jgi:hypothetical protein